MTNELDVLSWYAENKEHSVLGLFSNESALKIVSAAEGQSYNEGYALESSQKTSDLYIVVTGEIRVYTRGAERKLIETITPGRSLGLENILKIARENSRFEWITSAHCTLIRIARTIVEPILRKEPNLRSYLARVVGSSVLWRFKNDLSLFGLNQAEIVSTIALMQEEHHVDVITEGYGSAACLVCVRRGTLGIHRQESTGGEGTLGHYVPGDYLLVRDANALVFEGGKDTLLWCLNMEVLAERLGRGRVDRLLRILTIIDRDIAREEEDDGNDESLVATPLDEDEDDGLAVSDFKQTPKEIARAQKRKPKVVRQHDQMDCGAACLAGVAKFYGRKISLPTFRALVHVTREGASMLSLKKACEVVGLEAIGVMSSYKGLRKLRAPFIALMQYHFVVVYKVEDDKVMVGDPGRGLLELSKKEFVADWSKNALLMRPSPAFYEYPESAPTFRKYWSLFNDNRLQLAEIFASLLLGTVFGLIAPLFSQLVFDQVLGQGNGDALTLMTIVVVFLYLVSGGTAWIQVYLLSHLSARLDSKFAALFVRHVFKLPLSYFAVHNVGDITTRMGEIERIRDFFTGKTLSILISVFSAFVYLSIIWLYSLKLFLILLAILFFMILTLAALIPKLVATMRNLYKASAKVQSVNFEHFKNFATISSLGAKIAARWRWEELLEEQLKHERRIDRLGAVTSGSASLFGGVAKTLMLLFSVQYYLDGELSLGQVVSISMITGMVISPILDLMGAWSSFGQVGVSLARVDDVITSPLEPAAKTSAHEKHQLGGQVTFEKVCFRYGSEQSPLILDDITIDIAPGETIAFVGESGSGKSTLAFMVNLLYAPTKGRILLDGVDATEIPLETIREQVAMVIQDSELFSGTVLENITLGDPHPDFELAMKSAVEADAHDFIMQMPAGFSTLLGDGGRTLSGGQSQRINIARALYRQPTILIMDEATASLDAISERVIVNNVKSPGKARTTFIIAHRLNTIMYADRIVVLSQGRVAEMGSHHELLSKQGYYARLFRRQRDLG